MDASVAVWHRKTGALEVQSARPTRCASVLKPVYSWLSDHSEWESLSARAITTSDNEATSQLVGNDLPGLTQRLHERTDVSLEVAPTWGRFQVDALTLAQAYHALDVSTDDKAEQVKKWMEAVVPAQRFGFYGRLKAGWDLYEDAHSRPHLVTNLVLFNGKGGVTVTTDREVSSSLAQEWQTRVCVDSSAVIPLHLEALRSPRLHDLVGLGVSRLVAL